MFLLELSGLRKNLCDDGLALVRCTPYDSRTPVAKELMQVHSSASNDDLINGSAELSRRFIEHLKEPLTTSA